MTSDWFNCDAKFAVAADRRCATAGNGYRHASRCVLPLVCWCSRWRTAELTLSRNLAFSALVLLAVFVILPRIVFGSAYADMRLAPFMIATALLAIRFTRRDAMPDWRATSLCSAWLLPRADRARRPSAWRWPRTTRGQACGARPCAARGAVVRSGRAGLRRLVGNCRATAISARWRSSAAMPSPTTNGRSRAPTADGPLSQKPAGSAPTRRRSCARRAAPMPRSSPSTSRWPQFRAEAFDYVWTIDVAGARPATAGGLAARSGAARGACSMQRPRQPRKKPMTALSIVVPCFNEQECLPALHQRLTKAATAAVGKDYELVLVNDGSKDRTWPMMRELAAEDPRLVGDQPVAQPRPPAGADRRARPVRGARRS